MHYAARTCIYAPILLSHSSLIEISSLPHEQIRSIFENLQLAYGAMAWTSQNCHSDSPRQAGVHLIDVQTIRLLDRLAAKRDTFIMDHGSAEILLCCSIMKCKIIWRTEDTRSIAMLI